MKGQGAFNDIERALALVQFKRSGYIIGLNTFSSKSMGI